MARRFPMNFCPVCAAPLQRADRNGQVRPVCPRCDFVHFCDPKVAAVVVVEQDSKVLLARRAVNPEKGQWAFPGGFVECDEDPREAAMRECLEETGLEVEVTGLVDLFFGRQDSVIVLVFGARPVGGMLTAADDVDQVAFFGHDQSPELAFDSTREVMRRWQERQSPDFQSTTA